MQSMIRHYNMTGTPRRSSFFLSSIVTGAYARKIQTGIPVHIMIEDPRYGFEVKQNSDTTSSCSIVRALPSPIKRTSEATLLPKH